MDGSTTAIGGREGRTSAEMTAVERRAEALIRQDHQIMAQWIPERATVLDVGCGDGALLSLLQVTRSVTGRGLELSRANVSHCVAQGLSVIQGDADEDLANYPDNAFDFAVLSQTIQATRAPKDVLTQLLRIARSAIVSFPNFGHWRVRTQLSLTGRMPMTGRIPYTWYETPNIHFCTIDDFEALCGGVGARPARRAVLGESGRPLPGWLEGRWANLTATDAIFLLERDADERQALSDG